MSRKPTTLVSCMKWHPDTPSEVVLVKTTRNDKEYMVRRCNLCYALMSAAGNRQRWAPESRAGANVPYGPMLGVHALDWTPPEKLI